MSADTICLVQTAPDLAYVVTRTFRTADAAHRYANAQSRHVNIVRIAGKVHAGTKYTMAQYVALDRRSLS
jgi:hypothetical protein